MSNTPTSNNSDINRSTPVVNHDNQQETNNDQTAGLAEQTNNLNLDAMMEDTAPWIPDNHDGVEQIHPSQLGPNSKPETVIRYLRQQLIRCTSLITLATIRNNLDEVHTLNEQRKDFQEQLAIMEDVLRNEQSNQKVSTKDNRKTPVVPKDLPAFQLRGQHRHDKRRDSYDSAESFLDDFEVHLAAYELDVEDNWRRLIPMTCDANRRAWLLSTMKKPEIDNWISFRAEVERYFTSPYTIFYRRHRIRTMKQSKNQSLREYSNKLQEYAVKYGIPNNQDLVFNYLCSLNHQYRKKAWTLIANHHGDQIPDKLEPVVQMVQSLAATESPSDNSTSDSHSDSDEETDSDDDKPNSKRCRSNKNKSKGKGKAPMIQKKNACLLHPKSNHTRFDCEKLKEVLRMSRYNNNNNWQNNNSNKFGSRSFFGPSNRTYYNNGAGPSNSNLCRFCRRVPYVRGHECQEMLRARRSNINNNNNNNTVRSRMTHLSSHVEDMLSVNDDELMETSSNNNKGTIKTDSLLQYNTHTQNTNHSLKNNQTKQNTDLPSAIFVPITLQNKRILAFLDTGCDKSSLSLEYIKNNKLTFTPFTHRGSVITSIEGLEGKRVGELYRFRKT
ncbi:hypothetical protein INT45_005472 [Circinella minor]|uniref:Retrotransposon gag domain-containing protein n=1 Tax=Circinella minor TaxID=1195481 RepID=A0A8H7RV43_9FUNG|nr:hypothetical protein INT45_005472 [Circinella minor]